MPNYDNNITGQRPSNLNTTPRCKQRRIYFAKQNLRHSKPAEFNPRWRLNIQFRMIY